MNALYVIGLVFLITGAWLGYNIYWYIEREDVLMAGLAAVSGLVMASLGWWYIQLAGGIL